MGKLILHSNEAVNKLATQSRNHHRVSGVFCCIFDDYAYRIGAGFRGADLFILGFITAYRFRALYGFEEKKGGLCECQLAFKHLCKIQKQLMMMMTTGSPPGLICNAFSFNISVSMMILATLYEQKIVWGII